MVDGRVIPLFLVVSILLLPLPLPAAEAHRGVDASQDGCSGEAAADLCCEHTAPGDTSASPDGSCCPGGCKHCGLSCCSGSPPAALSSARPAAAAPAGTPHVPVPQAAPRTLSPGGIFRPPRS